MARIECSTLFDITETGVTGHCRPERFPFQDKSGAVISDDRSWNHSRNQQRNLETLIQLLSMRTQLESITTPTRHKQRWTFYFTVEHLTVFGENFEVLNQDSDGVPMIVGLTEGTKPRSLLIPGTNVWFKLIEA